MTIPTIEQIKDRLQRRYERYGIARTPEDIDLAARIELNDFQAREQAQSIINSLGLDLTKSQRRALFVELKHDIGHAAKINILESLQVELIGRRLFVAYCRKPHAKCHPLLSRYRRFWIGARGKVEDKS